MFSRALKLILKAFIWSLGLVNVHHTGTMLWVGGSLTMLGLRGPSWRRPLVASGVGAAAIAVLTNDGCRLRPGSAAAGQPPLRIDVAVDAHA